MKIERITIVIILVFIIGCAEESKKKFDLIFDDVMLANLEAIYEAEMFSLIPSINYVNGDTLVFREGVRAYLYGRDSLNGKDKRIDPSSIIIYQYKLKNNCVFSIYDSVGNYVDKGLLYEEELIKIMHGDFLEKTRSDFYKIFISERRKRYDLIERKYLISEEQIDSLLDSRLDSKP